MIKKLIKSFTAILVLSLVTGCNDGKLTLGLADQTTNSDSSGSGGTTSDITFFGIDFINSISDSTAVLNWTHVSGASAYQVLRVSGDHLYYVGSVDAPATTYNLTSLSANTSYSYRVRALDENANPDTNIKDVSFTTLGSPVAPTSLSLNDPVTSPAFDLTPTISVGGVKSGDTIKVFTDSSCSNLVGSAVATGTSVNITTSSLSAGSYTFYANATKTSSSSCSTVSLTYVATSCPIGYIPVPANATVDAPDNFCVMQFEAKDDGGGNPVSQAGSTPWVSISQVDAYNKCNYLNSELNDSDRENDVNNDGTYALISNPEWMAIARNVENVDANWTNGTVGQGCLKRGNIGGAFACTGGDSGYDGGDPDFGISRSDNGTAQLILDNGETIWDLSGNVWEWVDWTLGAPLSTNMTQVNKPYVGTDGTQVDDWRELDVIDNFTAHVPSTAILPSDSTFNANFGMGRVFTGTSGGAAVRGGIYAYGAYAGVFALGLSYTSTGSGGDIGFRCVYRP